MNPFQSFFDNPFQSFFDTQAFGGLASATHTDNNNMLFHTTSTFAQQGPDGVHYSQSQSSTFGPQGVGLPLNPVECFIFTAALAMVLVMFTAALLTTGPLHWQCCSLSSRTHALAMCRWLSTRGKSRMARQDKKK